ncbi:MAG: sulfur carrier protein ThiS [Bacteroidales bacterium]
MPEIVNVKPDYIFFMKVTLNNRPETIEGKDAITVRELLDLKNYTFKFLVVRINGQTVRPGEYEQSIIHDGDDVKVIHLISGG